MSYFYNWYSGDGPISLRDWVCVHIYYTEATTHDVCKVLIKTCLNSPDQQQCKDKRMKIEHPTIKPKQNSDLRYRIIENEIKPTYLVDNKQNFKTQKQKYSKGNKGEEMK